MTKSYWVYILTNASRSVLYTGMTNDMVRRVSEHRMGEGDSFASKYRCRHVVFMEVYNDVRDAIRREKQIKKWNRKWKEELIERENPEWRDLMPEDDGDV